MNDEFLHRIRVQPPPEFLSRLKSKLDRQPPPAARTTRGSWLRGFALGLLFGGSVFAITLLTINGVPESVRRLVSKPQPQRVADGPRNSSDGTNMRSNETGRTSSNTRPRQELAGGGNLSPERAGTPNARATTGGDQARTANQASGGTSSMTAAVSNGAPLIFKVIAPKELDKYAEKAGDAARLGVNFTTVVKTVPTSTEAIMGLCSSSEETSPPDIAFVTQKITASENEGCKKSGGSALFEVSMGYQAIIVVRSKLYGALELSRRDLFLALAAEIPDPVHPETLIRNPNTLWTQVDSALEKNAIQVIGPPLTSTTGMALLQLLIQPGCDAVPSLAALKQTDTARYDSVCTNIRKDGVYVEAEEAPFSLMQAVQSNPNAIGIMGYSLLPVSAELVSSRIEGVAPTLDSVKSGAYAASRPLYAYFSDSHPVGAIGALRYGLNSFARFQGRSPQTYSTLPPDKPQGNQQ